MCLTTKWKRSWKITDMNSGRQNWIWTGRKKDIKDFWRDFDAISGDIQNYIRNWADIRYYNYYKFMPNKFGNDTSEILDAIRRGNVD